jgi:hypothetical protein
MDGVAGNPPITRLLWGLTAVEALVVAIAGGMLFFWPDLARTLWPWALTPFNTAALGAVYLGALVAIVALVAVGRWAPARLVVPAIGAFTGIVLVISLLYADRFDFTRWGTWLWFVLYLILPLNAAYHWWRARRWPPAAAPSVALGWRRVLWGLAAVAGLYGVALLLLPEAMTSFWPWRLDTFHARLYSAAFLSVAIMAALAVRSAGKVELLTAGLSFAASGGLTLLSVLLVDARQQTVNWSAAGTWLWVAAFAVLLGVGLETARQGWTRPEVWHPRLQAE